MTTLFNHNWWEFLNNLNEEMNGRLFCRNLFRKSITKLFNQNWSEFLNNLNEEINRRLFCRNLLKKCLMVFFKRSAERWLLSPRRRHTHTVVPPRNEGCASHCCSCCSCPWRGAAGSCSIIACDDDARVRLIPSGQVCRNLPHSLQLRFFFTETPSSLLQPPSPSTRWTDNVQWEPCEIRKKVTTVVWMERRKVTWRALAPSCQ